MMLANPANLWEKLPCLATHTSLGVREHWRLSNGKLLFVVRGVPWLGTSFDVVEVLNLCGWRV
jgi:hypothetical protein